MKAAILFLSLLAMLPYALADDAKPRAGRLPAGCEVVMSPGMRITATTPVGTIAITAVDELTRSYTWDGATRAVEMSPQAARFFGSLGLFHHPQGEHWRDHHGITRCFTEDGQQHFKTVEEAMKWSKERDWLPFVYRDDGLMVGWNKFLGGKTLHVEVWQIFIDGKKPKRLPGSHDEKIVVETVETETVPLVKAVASNDLKAVTALLAKGADANVKNSVEIPVLVMAIRRGPAPLIETLLKNRADPNVRDVDTDLTPLWEALDRKALDRADIVKMLLAAGADVNAASRKEEDLLRGVTPLMAAAEDGREDLVQLFLDKGADVNAKTPIGFTALSMAKLSGLEDHRGVIRKLEAAGAKK
jgi:Ankyrin repeats (3 copies)